MPCSRTTCSVSCADLEITMSIPLTADASLHPLVLPARADAADAVEFRELARVRNAVYRELTGRTEQDLTPEALLPICLLYTSPSPRD